MGFRFRRKIRLFPGVSVNISKGGVSTSIGEPGATVNIGRRGARGTIGLPGTGIRYSEQLTNGDSNGAKGAGFGVLLAWALAIIFIGAVMFGVLTH